MKIQFVNEAGDTLTLERDIVSGDLIALVEHAVPARGASRFIIEQNTRKRLAELIEAL